MENPNGIRITVLSQKGFCAAGHREGDSWTLTRHTPGGLCLFAYSAMDPEIRTLLFGGAYPWSADRDVCVSCCPDPDNPVVFEIRRIPAQA